MLQIFFGTPFRFLKFVTSIVNIRYELYQNLEPLRSLWKAPGTEIRERGTMCPPPCKVGLIRRIFNINKHVNIKTKTNIVDEITQQLLNSSYDWDQVEKIIVFGLPSFENMVNRAKRTRSGLHEVLLENTRTDMEKLLVPVQICSKN